MVSFGKSKGGGRRAAPRVSAPLLAVLSTIGDDHQAAIVNISGRGGRFSAPHLPSEGQEVIFKAGNVEAFGHVVWTKGTQCGVAFENPITSVEVDRLRSEVNIMGLAGLSPDDRPSAEEWELGIGR